MTPDMEIVKIQTLQMLAASDPDLGKGSGDVDDFDELESRPMDDAWAFEDDFDSEY